MKIAVISDIHGNMEALNAVLKDIEEQGCERIFALGDYAMAGPQPAEAVQFFMSKEYEQNYSMIQGNTDLLIADYSIYVFNALNEKAPIMSEALKNDVDLLNNNEKEFLKNLPIQLKCGRELSRYCLNLCEYSPKFSENYWGIGMILSCFLCCFSSQKKNIKKQAKLLK